MTTEIAAVALMLAELLAACVEPEPVTIGNVLSGDVTVVTEEPVNFTRIDTESDVHMAICGDRRVADVPPPDPPPPPTLQETVDRGLAMGIVAAVYRVREFDPHDARYDPDLVWRDGWGNYWCQLGVGLTAP